MHIDSFGLFGCALEAFLQSKKFKHYILQTQFCKLFEPTSLKNLSNSSRSDSEISFWWRSWNLWAKTSTTVMAQVWKQFYPVYHYHKLTLVKIILSRFSAFGNYIYVCQLPHLLCHGSGTFEGVLSHSTIFRPSLECLFPTSESKRRPFAPPDQFCHTISILEGNATGPGWRARHFLK